jgi:signal peptidase II
LSLAAKRGTGLGLALLTLVLDQLTKLWALGALQDPPVSITVTGWWDMVLVWNHGISFGVLGAGALSPWVLAAVTGAIALGVAVWLFRSRHWLAILTAGLILGGAVGNIIDRLVYGAVVDFVRWHAYGYSWPVFNLADAAITLGIALLIAESLFGGRSTPKSAAE